MRVVIVLLLAAAGLRCASAEVPGASASVITQTLDGRGQLPDALPDSSTTPAADNEELSVDSNRVAATTERLSDRVRAVLQHFKQADPTGFPGTEVPDPMSVPPMNQSFALATMSFSNVTVHGLSQFRFHEGNVNLTTMKAMVTARIQTTNITGNYTLCTWLSCSAGGFTVTLEGVLVSALAGLEVGPGGRLRAEEIGMDVLFDKIQMDFQNLGFMMSIFQGMINKVGSFLFDNIKPFILSEINKDMREEVDKQVATVDFTFPVSMTPIDVVIANARHTVRTLGYDPYRIPDITKKAGPVEATLTHVFATGLSSFYRRGDVSVWMSDHVLHAGVHLATRKLRGTLRWAVHAPGLPAVLYPLMRRAGDASFTVDYLEVNVVLNQSLDTRNHPFVERLDLTLGPVVLVSRGDAGKLNAFTEFGVNVLPNLLRYQIVDALEAPIMRRIQDVLDTIDVEELIDERLSDLEARLAKQDTPTSDPGGPGGPTTPVGPAATPQPPANP